MRDPSPSAIPCSPNPSTPYPPPHMKSIIRGTAYVLGDHVDTDQIIPAQHLVYSLTDPEEIISFDRAIGAEDKAMLERVPGVLPLGRTDLVSVQSDKPSVEWRRRFATLVGAEAGSSD